ncbi:MAG: hypothetical protein MK171_04045 [Pirellulales bacterium]|nr:hypothetical protein [Pirellulales bacterium]
MLHSGKVLVVAFALVFVAQLLWRRWRKSQQRAQRQLACLEFPELRPVLQAKFLTAAAATGKPRGLIWKQCDLAHGELFALNPATGELYALVGATISFKAIPGGAMEEVEAVGNLRSATAIFVHRQGCWTTDGRVVFNLTPHEALARFEDSLQPIQGIATQ